MPSEEEGEEEAGMREGGGGGEQQAVEVAQQHPLLILLLLLLSPLTWAAEGGVDKGSDDMVCVVVGGLVGRERDGNVNR